MEIDTLIIILLSLVSFAAGFIDSIAGGGGLLMLPSYLLAGLPPHIAIGTNKLVATSGTGVAIYNFVRKGKVSLPIILSGVLFALGGAFVGAKVILLFEQDTVNKVIVSLLPFGMLATLYPKKNIIRKEELRKKDLYFKVPLICLITGFYDGFFGPGTGAFLALFLHIFLKLNLIEATANTKIFNFISTFGSLIVFMWNGKVWYIGALPMVATNMLGNYLGSHLAIQKGEKVIRLFLVIVLIILFVTLVWKLGFLSNLALLKLS